jgi:microcystin-dependent protein
LAVELDNISNMTQGDLRRFIVNLLASDPGAVPAQKSSEPTATGSLPVGSLVDWGGSGDPADINWLLADGRAISRTAYPLLFTALGTTYGAGDGSTTFNIPDLRGRVSIGPDNMGTAQGDAGRIPSNDARGNTDGAATHTLSISEIPSHDHGLRRHTNLSPSALGGNTAAPVGAGDTSAGVTFTTGGGGAHNNLQPYQVINKIIRVR